MPLQSKEVAHMLLNLNMSEALNGRVILMVVKARLLTRCNRDQILF